MFRQEDRPGTRSPGRMFGSKLAERFHQIRGGGQFAECRTFAAGDDQAIQSGEFFGLAHFDRIYPDAAQDLDVFSKMSLKGKNAYCCHSHGLSDQLSTACSGCLSQPMENAAI